MHMCIIHTSNINHVVTIKVHVYNTHPHFTFYPVQSAFIATMPSTIDTVHYTGKASEAVMLWCVCLASLWHGDVPRWDEQGHTAVDRWSQPAAFPVICIRWWHCGLVVEHWTCNHKVLGSSLTRAKLCSNPGQVIHTYVPLTSRSIGPGQRTVTFFVWEDVCRPVGWLPVHWDQLRAQRLTVWENFTFRKIRPWRGNGNW